MWLECFRQASAEPSGSILGEANDDIIFFVYCAIAGVVVIISLVNIFLGCCVGESSSGFSIDFNIAFGSMLLCFTVLVRGLNTMTQLVEDDVKQAICQLYPATLLIGLTQLVGGMFVKAWGIFLYFKFNNDKRPLSEEWKPNLWIWFLLVIAGAASLVWVFMFTPKYDSMGEKEHFECKQHTCTSEHELEWKIATSAWHGFLLILAAVGVLANCFATRKTAGFAEANLLGLAVLNTLITVAAGICLHFLYDGTVNGVTYAINGGLMLWICLFANIMFLVSKLVAARRSSNDYVGDNYDTIKSERSGTGISTSSGGFHNPAAEDGGEREQFNY